MDNSHINLLDDVKLIINDDIIIDKQGSKDVKYNISYYIKENYYNDRLDHHDTLASILDSILYDCIIKSYENTKVPDHIICTNELFPLNQSYPHSKIKNDIINKIEIIFTNFNHDEKNISDDYNNDDDDDDDDNDDTYDMNNPRDLNDYYYNNNIYDAYYRIRNNNDDNYVSNIVTDNVNKDNNNINSYNDDDDVDDNNNTNSYDYDDDDVDDNNNTNSYDNKNLNENMYVPGYPGIIENNKCEEFIEGYKSINDDTNIIECEEFTEDYKSINGDRNIIECKGYRIVIYEDVIHISITNKCHIINHSEIFEIINSNRNIRIEISLYGDSILYNNFNELFEYIIKDIDSYIIKTDFLKIRCKNINTIYFYNFIKILSYNDHYISIKIINNEIYFKMCFNTYTVCTYDFTYHLDEISSNIINMISLPYYVCIRYTDSIQLHEKALNILYGLKCRNIELCFCEKFIIPSEILNKLLIDLNVYKIDICYGDDDNDCKISDIIDNTNIKELVIYRNTILDDKLCDYLKNNCIGLKSSYIGSNIFNCISESKDIKYIEFFDFYNTGIQLDTNDIKLLIGHPSLEYIKLWSDHDYSGDLNEELPNVLSQIIKKNKKCNTFKFCIYSDSGCDQDYYDLLNDITSEIAFTLKKSYNIVNFNIDNLRESGMSKRIKKYILRNKQIGILYLLLSIKRKLIPFIPIFILINIYKTHFFL